MNEYIFGCSIRKNDGICWVIKQWLSYSLNKEEKWKNPQPLTLRACTMTSV